MQEGKLEEGPKWNRKISERRCCQNRVLKIEREFARKPEGKIQETYREGRGVP